jgi:serine/threonine protein kinase
METRAYLTQGSMLCGKYKIESHLGSGGFSLVYKCSFKNEIFVIKEAFDRERCYRDESTKKVLPKVGCENVHLRQVNRAKQEFERAASLRHQNIVEIVNGFAEHNTFYLVMPFVKGADLEDFRLKSKTPFTRDTTYAFLRPVFSAVGFLHSKGVLHRDIKPDNIWITTRNIPILLDTGSARTMEDARSLSTGILTRMGAPELRGSAEVARYGQITSAADVFSLGAVFGWLLTGNVPEAENRELALTNGQKDPLEKWAVPNAPVLSTVIRQALSLHVKDRFKTVEDFDRALYRALQNESQAPPRPFPTPPSNEIPAKVEAAGWGVVMTTILLLTLLCGLAYEGSEMIGALLFLGAHSFISVLLGTLKKRESFDVQKAECWMPVFNFIYAFK